MKPAEGPEQLTFRVGGTPATFATAGERPWREAISAAAIVAMGAREPLAGRLRVEIGFQMPPRGSGIRVGIWTISSSRPSMRSLR